MDANQVSAIFRDSLFKEGEDYSVFMPGQGVMHKIGFHPERLKSHEAEVKAMIDELPIEFLSEQDGGKGGWSFLNLCNDRNGHQWTGMHATMDELCTLAIAMKLAAFLLPREMWSILPGGMPYVVFFKEPQDATS